LFTKYYIQTKVNNSDELKQQQIEVLCAAKQHVIDAAIHNIHQWFTSDTKLHLNACLSKADILNKVCDTFKRLKLHFTYFVNLCYKVISKLIMEENFNRTDDVLVLLVCSGKMAI